MLRGRFPVHADHQLRTDEEAIRAQLVILNKTPEPFPVLLEISFSARMPFIRAENEVGARSAQLLRWFRLSRPGSGGLPNSYFQMR
jgi:hypothetical protein